MYVAEFHRREDDLKNDLKNTKERVRSLEVNLREAEVGVLVSIESSGMGLYKSFAYEIFKRMPSALLAFDGNSAAMNLIQEARNGREKCSIFLNPRSRGLAVKARTLEGYVRPLQEAEGYLRSLAAERG